MEAFRFLHFTDLHWGSKDHKTYWDSIESELFADLVRVQNRCGGPWDAVFFTGDLVNKGQKKEYDGLNEELVRLHAKILEQGSDPVFLAVPGNHDLTRPSDEADPGVVAITDSWSKVSKSVWEGRKSGGCWKTINAVFRNYESWRQANDFPLRRPDGLRDGRLPGDFRVTLDKSGLKIGVIGLNTTLRQLTGGDYEGKLEVNAAQIEELLDTHPNDWFQKHHVSFLLTHQPVNWLSADGKKEFDTHIAPVGRFAIHLCGHQHETWMANTALAGNPQARRELLSNSLFSQEAYVDWKSGKEGKVRRHGYSAGMFEFSRDEAQLRLWPRLAVIKGDGKTVVQSDPLQHLEEDEGTAATTIGLTQPLSDDLIEILTRGDTGSGSGQVASAPKVIDEVIGEMAGILDDSPASFCDALLEHGRELNETVFKTEESLPGDLCDLPMENALGCIVSAMASVQQAPSSNDAVKKGMSLAGYQLLQELLYLLMCSQRGAAGASASTELSVDAGTPTGAELGLAIARNRRPDFSPSADDFPVGKGVVEGVGTYLEVDDISSRETGMSRDARIDAIEQLIWNEVYPESGAYQPQKHRDLLNDYLGIGRKDAQAEWYIIFSAHEHDRGLLDELHRRLNELTVVVIRNISDSPMFSFVREPKLAAYVGHVLRIATDCKAEI